MHAYDLIKSDVRILCSPSHELAQASSISLKDLESQQFILRSDNASEAFSDMWSTQSHVQFETNPLLFERKIHYENCMTFAFQIPCAPYWIPNINHTVRIPFARKNSVYLALICHNHFKATPQAKSFSQCTFQKIKHQAYPIALVTKQL